MTSKKPTGEIVTGYGAAPNSWKKLKMVTIEEPTDNYDKIYWGYSVACPMIKQYIHPSECESCDCGRLGSYKEKWTICSYNSSTPTKKEVDI